MMKIEPLELRIAPAAIFINATTATYLDVDGDQVTVKFSKPILTPANAASVLITATAGMGEQLRTIDLTIAGLPSPAGTNLSITAKPQDLAPVDGIPDKSGDGQANVGWLTASGIDLGVVSIAGDVGRINYGANSPNVPAIKSLTVRSLGEQGFETGAGTV